MIRAVLPLAPWLARRFLWAIGRLPALALPWMAAAVAGLGAAGCNAGPAEGLVPQAIRSADPLLGQRLVTQYQCGSCHAIPGVPAARGIQGPSLEAFGRRSYIAGQIPNRPEALVRWIVQPAALVPGTLMPSMGVSPGEARHMAAYLGTLR